MKAKTEPRAVPAAEPAGAPPAIHFSVGPSPALIQFLKDNPGAKIVFEIPKGPRRRRSDSVGHLPAFQIETYRRDSHRCPRCARTFSVRYSNVHAKKPLSATIAVACYWCAEAVGVPVPEGVDLDAVTVGEGLGSR